VQASLRTMSKHNKVNKTNYDQAGRLTPDELARERARQIHMEAGKRKFSERRRTTNRGERVSNQDRTAHAKGE
jgi:hypothetical protein